MRLSYLSEYFDASRTGYLVPRSLYGVTFTATHEVFRLPSVPIQLNERFILSQV